MNKNKKKKIVKKKYKRKYKNMSDEQKKKIRGYEKKYIEKI